MMGKGNGTMEENNILYLGKKGYMKEIEKEKRVKGENGILT